MPQTTAQTLDRIYDGFIASLPASLRPAGRNLPQRLGLATLDSVPWSVVFNNPAVLGLPLLLADPSVPAGTVDAAATTHLMAIIGAFGADRIRDGQIAADSTTAILLEEVCRVRDAAEAALVQGTPHAMTCRWAQARGQRAEAESRAVFGGAREASWEHYAAIALMKQGMAFPGGIGMAKAAGWSADACQQVRAFITGAALGLQHRDDVVDWPDDDRRGVSWAVQLTPGAPDGETREAWLHRHGTLIRMLHLSGGAFLQAAEAAVLLGAPALASWAVDQATLTGQLADAEARSPGLAVRWEQNRQAKKARRHRRAIERMAA